MRSTYIIDPKGIIRRHWPEVIPQGHAERVRQALAELQAGRAAGAAATPGSLVKGPPKTTQPHAGA